MLCRMVLRMARQHNGRIGLKKVIRPGISTRGIRSIHLISKCGTEFFFANLKAQLLSKGIKPKVVN